LQVILSCTINSPIHRRLEQNVARQRHSVHLHPATVDHCCRLVDSLLRNKGRTLTADQWSLVAETLGHLPSTQFARLIFEEVQHWRWELGHFTIDGMSAL
jgi:hypothetical protein